MTEPIRHLNLSELFGPTIQGEGRNTGHLAMFLRLAGCNLSCDWCDTPYTWDWSRHDYGAEVERVRIGQVADALNLTPGRIVVTGGEPLLQARGIAELMNRLPARVFDLETNGTRPLGPTRDRWAHITCSPKIGPSSGQRADTAQLHPDLLDSGADYKFVIATPDDLTAVDDWHQQHPHIPPSRMWLMPEGTRPDTVTAATAALAPQAISRGYQLSTRLHVLIWGNERGH